MLWSGHTSALMLGFAFVSCAFVVWMTRRMEIADHESQPSKGLRPVVYIPWLMLQVVLSGFAVARVIVDPRLPIQPRLIRVPADQKTQLGQVVYANSITLTPGTLSLDLRDDHILVHALTEATAQDVQTGEMGRRVARIEGKA